MIVAVQPCDANFLREPKHALEVSYWRGADMIELRLDFAPKSEWPQVLAAIAHAPCHLIVTCRRVRDGGKFSGDEALRLGLLRQFAQAGVRYVDIESDIVDADAIADPPSALRSFHNMEETNLEELRAELAKLKAQAAFNVKFATRANGLADNLIHREILKEMDGLWLKASFGIGMPGMPSRLLQPFWGGGLVYCAAKGAETLLPNLPTQADLVRVYRMRYWFTNKAKLPKLYGLAGSPIALSMSPTIHNGFFARHKVDAFYLPLESEDADEVAAFARELGFAGLSVTIPLKEKIAEAFGGAACVFNTVKLDDGPPAYANTDIAAFRQDLRFLIDDQKLSQARVLILGAGGAAYAAVEALKHDAGEVLITNRTAARAKALAAKTGVGFHPNPIEDEFGFDLIVNATPCGHLHSPIVVNSQSIQFDDLKLNSGACVYNLVARGTLWACEGDQAKRVRGYRDGLGMLVLQAVAQEQVWGLRPEGMHFDDTRIAVIGFRGSGKTTIGERVATKLEVPFIDLDQAIEARVGMSISAFFDEFGEAAFRDIETNTLAKALGAKPNFVLSCGGGVVERSENMRLLFEHARIVHLKATERKIRQNLEGGERPSLHVDGIDGELRDIFPRREIRHEAIRDQFARIRRIDDLESATRSLCVAASLYSLPVGKSLCSAKKDSQ